MSLKRVDQILLDLFPELTRSKVQSLIEKSKIQILDANRTWVSLGKPGKKYEEHELKKENFKILDDDELYYVSRGALKLKHAIETFNIDISNKVCLDVGLSTGGFTDYLLQGGVKSILGIDVGTEQVHPKLKINPRLKYYDKINAKEPIAQEILNTFFQNQEFGFDLIVVDVSFISLSLIIPNLASLLKSQASVVALIKPQFELSRADLNKKGVVKDPAQVSEVVKKIGGVFVENGLKIMGETLSPIEGENGNKEVLMFVRKP